MSTRSVTAWLALLQGHVFDLEDLPLLSKDSLVSVVKRDADYFLRIPVTLSGTSHARTRELATEYVNLLNGAARLLAPGHRSISLAEGGLLGIDSAGELVTTVLQVGCAESRCKGGHMRLIVNGVAAPDPREGALKKYLLAAEAYPAKADALAIIGRPNPSWSELYLVYELVEAAVGSRMLSANWIKSGDAKLFSRTANSYTALGRAGRHGKNKNPPPATPMKHADALSLIRALAGHWILDSAAPKQTR